MLCAGGVGTTATASASASACANAAAATQAQDLDRAARTVRCLINDARARRHLPAVRPASRLQRAAARHSRAMLSAGLFDHTVPGELPLAVRVRRTGYLTRARRWSLGEAIAWAQGDQTSPRALVAALLASPPHRAILLDPRFREIGVGLLRGVPRSRAHDVTGATLTLDFGRVTQR
ncbi:MAG: hypothetical protein JWM31_3096 [Solirubrobacterales bacterium]|nr:hypothetical protein [Solirubrobacterales bacterium]